MQHTNILYGLNTMNSVLPLFLLSFGCINQPPTARLFLGMESEMEDVLQLHVESLEIRSEDMKFDDPWLHAQTISNGVRFVHTKSLTEIGFVELETRQDYIQTFVDVDSIFWNTSPIEDIVEPIATPFSSRYGMTYNIVVQLSIINQQLFATDAYVVEESI